MLFFGYESMSFAFCSIPFFLLARMGSLWEWDRYPCPTQRASYKINHVYSCLEQIRDSLDARECRASWLFCVRFFSTKFGDFCPLFTNSHQRLSTLPWAFHSFLVTFHNSPSSSPISLFEDTCSARPWLRCSHQTFCRGSCWYGNLQGRTWLLRSLFGLVYAKEDAFRCANVGWDEEACFGAVNWVMRQRSLFSIC